ncbi:UDP-N-acetylmuramoyl-L-alanyl-D-glutamate--2,6-diaminopimelate ligase [Candidatus Parcubacteria bacterium]|nr:UDP-N-acetylmuramoyl-L-alanyl-D-glutamate--2,6-diaminopimelate ligase [Patescibacteria group bacterium]MBU4466820.1 UDP-N-acetylmuramoyl-L-alanyl-D-glutamate--2,6-diaminopimelate ligase [Patescibacteria group bacterium]MCG2688123.1 UDP-N-acetylmuramoyl-L-alanyl-D-glutamate--2,6-diaminopimelate ligase [Candidatus Parcubacteria bacterium]
MKDFLYQLKNTIKKIAPSFLLDWYHFSLVFLAALAYGFPSKKLKVIGVTGTSGKSTVLEMTSNILEKAGCKVASLSSIRFRLAGKEEPNNLRMTLPGRFFVQKFLRKAVNCGCEYAVLEITSEGIKQYRHFFIDFKAVALTNLSPEHIEAHGSFEKYKEAKGKLFQAAKNIHIINIDDENAEYFLKFPSKQKFYYGLNNNLKIGKYPAELGISRPEARKLEIDCKLKIENCKFIKATDVNTSSSGINFKVENTAFYLHLLGGFNIYNALTAISIARSQGISLETCRLGLERFRGVSGRMEKVIDASFKAFVDYAITPNALEKAYQTLIGNYKTDTNSLICVLGSCGGGRDKWKRPVLGEIASRYCDRIILTNEDPYDEDPNEILSMIKEGVFKTDFNKNNFYEIIDRRQAIKKGLELAGLNDIFIITGKGCEPSMCLAGGRQITWDDRLAVREEFASL